MPNAGPIVHEALATLPLDFAGPVLTSFLASSPDAFAGPPLHEALAALPDTFAGPVLHEEKLEVSVPNYSGPSGAGPALLSPTNTYSGQTDAVARIPPPQGFSGVTGGLFPRTAVPTFGGLSGARAVVSARNHSGVTGDRASSILPARGFGAGTGGVVTGIETPMSLTATVIDAGCIRLDWIDPGPPANPGAPVEDGYRIERSLTGANDWSSIGLVGMDVETFLDRFAVPLVSYDYRVIGFNTTNESLPSNIATAVTPLPPDISTGPPPTAPVDPPRNRITPDVVEFKSPGTYGLAKDEDGNVTGFKF